MIFSEFLIHAHEHIESFSIFETTVCEESNLIYKRKRGDNRRERAIEYRMNHLRLSTTVCLYDIRDVVARSNHLIDKRYNKKLLNYRFCKNKWPKTPIIPRSMVMPPDGTYTWHKKLCQSRYCVHGRVIGNNHVHMSKLVCQSHYLKRFLEDSVLRRSHHLDIQTFLEFWKTCVSLFKRIERHFMSLFLECMGCHQYHFYRPSETCTLWM